MQKDTFEVLVKESGYSKSKLQQIFRHYLSMPPTFIIHQKLRLYLIIDGTYFIEGLCLVLYYDSQLKYSRLYRFSSNEFYKEIKQDLESLKELSIDIAAVSLADMFHFIGDKNIPKSTNGLDSYFGHLKPNLNVHRGLSKKHRQAFILWYLHLRSIRL